MRVTLKSFIGLVSIMMCMACNKQTISFYNMSLEDQFNYAKTKFDKRDYLAAKEQFVLIVVRNPAGVLVEKSQFHLAECNYKLKEYVLAIEEYDKLIRTMPQSEYVDDAYYMIGMCYYQLSPGYALDQEYTYKAIEQFQAFLEEYPKSDLKSKIEEQIGICREKLAKKEFMRGELYRKMGYYESAVISYDSVLESYYDTIFADDAVFWKGECFRIMRKWDDAIGIYGQLFDRYPNSDFTARAKERIERAEREKRKDSSEGSI